MSAMNSLMLRLRNRRPAFWIIASWIVTTLAGITIVGLAGGGCTAHTTQDDGTPAGVSAATPLANAQQMSVARASSAIGFKVPVPATSIASQGNLTATWARADMRQVALVFDQGKLTIVIQPAVYQDPSTDYQTFISENSAQASVSHVAGLPVLTITPNTDYYRTNPALVRFDLNRLPHKKETNYGSPDFNTTPLRPYQRW